MTGNPDGRWGKYKFPVPVDFWVCFVAVNILTFVTERSMLTTGSSVEKYMSVSTESIMPVSFESVLLGTVSMDMSRLGLKLA